MTDVSSASAAAPVRRTAPRFRRIALGTAIVAVCAVISVWGVLAWRWRAKPAGDEFASALAAIDRGDLPAARQFIVKLKALPGTENQATFLRGAILLRKGYSYPALDDFGQVKDDPALKQLALTRMGQGWYGLGRHVEAQTALQEVVKNWPDYVDGHRWLAASYYDLGAIHNALQHLEQTAALDPADPRPHRLLGLINKDYERYDQAVPMYEETLRRKGDQPDALDIREELATCQLRLRRHQAALATLAPCPDSPEVSVIRAECYYALGNPTQAKAALTKANQQQPGNLDVLLLRGTMLLEEGNAPRAVEVLTLAIQSHPKDYTAHFKLAQAHAQSGQEQQARQEREVAEKIREIRKEFAELHQAAWDRPYDIQVRMRLAALAGEMGRPDLTEVWLKSAAALQPLSGSAGQPRSTEQPRSPAPGAEPQ